jgi:hypothetical protein
MAGRSPTRMSGVRSPEPPHCPPAERESRANVWFIPWVAREISATPPSGCPDESSAYCVVHCPRNDTCNDSDYMQRDRQQRSFGRQPLHRRARARSYPLRHATHVHSGSDVGSAGPYRRRLVDQGLRSIRGDCAQTGGDLPAFCGIGAFRTAALTDASRGRRHSQAGPEDSLSRFGLPTGRARIRTASVTNCSCCRCIELA